MDDIKRIWGANAAIVIGIKRFTFSIFIIFSTTIICCVPFDVNNKFFFLVKVVFQKL